MTTKLFHCTIYKRDNTLFPILKANVDTLRINSVAFYADTDFEIILGTEKTLHIPQDYSTHLNSRVISCRVSFTDIHNVTHSALGRYICRDTTSNLTTYDLEYCTVYHMCHNSDIVYTCNEDVIGTHNICIHLSRDANETISVEDNMSKCLKTVQSQNAHTTIQLKSLLERITFDIPKYVFKLHTSTTYEMPWLHNITNVQELQTQMSVIYEHITTFAVLCSAYRYTDTADRTIYTSQCLQQSLNIQALETVQFIHVEFVAICYDKNLKTVCQYYTKSNTKIYTRRDIVLEIDDHRGLVKLLGTFDMEHLKDIHFEAVSGKRSMALPLTDTQSAKLPKWRRPYYIYMSGTQAHTSHTRRFFKNIYVY